MRQRPKVLLGPHQRARVAGDRKRRAHPGPSDGAANNADYPRSRWRNISRLLTEKVGAECEVDIAFPVKNDRKAFRKAGSLPYFLHRSRIYYGLFGERNRNAECVVKLLCIR